MLCLWLALEWYTGQLTLNTPFKLDVNLVGTQMSFRLIRHDISSKQASNQLGVYKQWIGLLGWWNSGLESFCSYFHYFVMFNLPYCVPPNFLHIHNSNTQQQYIATGQSHEPQHYLVKGLQGPCWVEFLNTFYALSNTQNQGVDYTIKR